MPPPLKADKAAAALKKERARSQRLEKQRNELLEQLEEARRAKAPRRVKAAPKRRRKRGDIVRYGFGDLHGNRYHPATLAAVLRDLKMLAPDELLLGGDMINCGGFLAEHHTPGYVAENDDSYEDDLITTNGLLDQIQAAAGNARIEYLEGNHEQRVERWIMTQKVRNRRDVDFLYRQFAPYHLLGIKGRGIAYHRRSERHDDCRIPGWIKRGKIFFVHEISSAKNAASAAIDRTAGNVVYFHTHRADSSTRYLPGVGLVAAHNPGCCCELQPLWRNTNPSGWNHGAFVQFIAPSGNFLHINIPINDGKSLLQPLLQRGA